MFGTEKRMTEDRPPIITESVKVYSLETNSQFAPGVFPGPKNWIPMIGLFEHIVL